MTRTSATVKLSVLVAAIGLLAVAVSGCGASTSADDTGGVQDRGRQLFNAHCGTCHVMAQAGSQGVQGPNLDRAFAAGRAAGLGSSTIEGVVAYQIKHPRPSEDGFPGISMPANIVSGNDVDDIAAYVAAYAGVPGVKPPAAPGEGPGAQVFADNGCGSCHVLAAAQAAGTLGPDLDEVVPGLSRKEVEQSIVDPNAVKAKGYENAVMPDRFSSLPPEQLQQLIDFLIASTSGGGSGKSGG